MTSQPKSIVQNGVEIEVPLNRLKTSPKNVRRTKHTESEIAALAASIAAKGVLQPPVVEPERDNEGAETGCYLVTIGEGRRSALELLVKRRLIAKTALVRCLLDGDNDAAEISLDENLTRFAMHPADQFAAFLDLSERKGWSAEDIATRFGVTAHLVRQRLRLGAASPVLMAAYRAGELTLDQLMAFCVSEDRERQEQVFANLSYNRSPHHIRNAMTEDHVSVQDRRAVCVGPEAYEAAGGYIRRDLFAEDHGGWFEDIGLLDGLVLAGLDDAADRLRAQEGWLWVEVHLDFPHGHGLRRVYPLPTEDEARERCRQLGEEYDEIIARIDDDESVPEPLEARLREIETALEHASVPKYAAEDYRRAGAFVSLGWDGTVELERGFLRAEQEAPAEPLDAINGGKVSEAPTPKHKGLSERLVCDLTAHRTAALRDRLAKDPTAAMTTLLHALVLQTMGGGAEQSALELSATSKSLRTFAEGYDQSPAANSIAERHEGWVKRLQQADDGLWSAILCLSDEDRANLLAHCVSLTVNAVQTTDRPKAALRNADLIADQIDLDMTAYWRATAVSYFDRVTKAEIAQAVQEAVGPAEALKLARMDKAAMATAAADLLGSKGWLPPLLRAAAVPST